MARRIEFSTREWKKVLEKNGFELARTKGDHFIYKRGNEMIVATKNPNCMCCRRLIQEYKLEV